VISCVRGAVAGGGVPEGGDGLAGELERDGALDGAAGAVAGLAASEDRLTVFYRTSIGLITNGKFCCVRRLPLSLTWWRRPLRLRACVLQTDVALSSLKERAVSNGGFWVCPGSREGYRACRTGPRASPGPGGALFPGWCRSA